MTNILALLTALVTLTFVGSPLVTSPFSGFRADQLPVPQIDPPVQPAGWAFAIWGLIYSWLVVSAVFGLWKRGADPEWNVARKPLILCLAVGSFWLSLANASAIWATVLIFVMAVSAIAAALRAPERDRWLLQAPVAILAGWLTAASFVSLGSTAAGYGLVTDSLGWAWICIVAALAVGLAVQFALARAPEYGLTFVWALTGIIAANLGRHATIAGLAALGILLLLGMILFSRRRLGPV